MGTGYASLERGTTNTVGEAPFSEWAVPLYFERWGGPARVLTDSRERAKRGGRASDRGIARFPLKLMAGRAKGKGSRWERPLPARWPTCNGCKVRLPNETVAIKYEGNPSAKMNPDSNAPAPSFCPRSCS